MRIQNAPSQADVGTVPTGETRGHGDKDNEFAGAIGDHKPSEAYQSDVERNLPDNARALVRLHHEHWWISAMMQRDC
jgi:hypothetical protein